MFDKMKEDELKAVREERDSLKENFVSLESIARRLNIKARDEEGNQFDNHYLVYEIKKELDNRNDKVQKLKKKHIKAARRYATLKKAYHCASVGFWNQ